MDFIDMLANEPSTVMVLIGILVTVGGGVKIWDSLRVLTIVVPPLKSRKAFNEFDPDGYLVQVSQTDFRKIEAMTADGSKKKVLRIKWSYTTPSGKTSYNDSKKYKLPAIAEYVDKVSPIFNKELDRISGLNKLYAAELESGREVEDSNPKIYCYVIPGSDTHEGLVKVGYAKNNAFKRVEQQFKSAAHLGIKYEILFIMPAVTISGEQFMDHKVHRLLKDLKIENPFGEWFRCSSDVARQAVEAVQMNAKSPNELNM